MPVRVDDRRCPCEGVRRRTPSYRALLLGHSNGRRVDPPRRPCKAGAPPPWPEGPSWAPPGQACCRHRRAGRAPPHVHAGGGGVRVQQPLSPSQGGFRVDPGGRALTPLQGRESSPAALPGGGRPPLPHHLGAAALVCKPIPQMQALMHRCGAWPRPPRRSPNPLSRQPAAVPLLAAFTVNLHPLRKRVECAATGGRLAQAGRALHEIHLLRCTCTE